MAAGTVTIDSSNFSVYGTTADLAVYVKAKPSATVALWDAKTADDQARAHVTATRLFDQLVWSGTKSVSSQPIEWPRDGAYDGHTGTTLDDGAEPQPLINAVYELAIGIALNPKYADRLSVEQKRNLKSVKAGSAQVEFFGASDVYSGAPLPDEVLVMVTRYLGNAASGLQSFMSYGDEYDGAFDEDTDGYGLSGGFS